MDANLTLASLYAVVDAIGPAPKPSVLIVAHWMRYSNVLVCCPAA